MKPSMVCTHPPELLAHSCLMNSRIYYELRLPRLPHGGLSYFKLGCLSQTATVVAGSCIRKAEPGVLGNIRLREDFNMASNKKPRINEAFIIHLGFYFFLIFFSPVSPSILIFVSPLLIFISPSFSTFFL